MSAAATGCGEILTPVCAADASLVNGSASEDNSAVAPATTGRGLLERVPAAGLWLHVS